MGGSSTARLSMRAGTTWADLSRVVRTLGAEPALGFRGGGHQGAAGGDAPIERLGDVAALFARATAAQAPPEPLKYRLTVDAELSLTELTPEACRAISRLQPFGPGNRAPTLLVRRLRLVGQARALGSSGRHFRLSVADAAGVYAGAVWWDGNPQRLPQGEFDALAAIEQNEFNGSSEVRLVVQAVRPTAAPAPVRLQQGVLL
jgi:single-stranded-DNA-specific exonuclease